MRIAAVIAVMLFAATASAQTTRPTTRAGLAPDVVEAMLEEGRAFEALKLQDTVELPGDLENKSPVELRVTDGLLVTIVHLPAQHAAYRLPVGENAAARLTVRAYRSGDEPGIRFIDIERPLVGTRSALETDPQAVVAGFTGFAIDVARSAMQLSRHVDYLDGHLDMTLTQRPPTGDEDEPYISLRADFTPTGADGPEDGTHVLIETNSFAGLRRDHREEFDRYVVPALEDLGLAAALDAETRLTAIQVFLLDLPVEEGVEGQVEALLAKLNSEAFPERAAAQRELAAMGRPAATVLMRKLAAGDGEAFSGEQAARVEAFLAKFRTIDTQTLAELRHNRDFLENVIALPGKENAMLREIAQCELDGLTP